MNLIFEGWRGFLLLEGRKENAAAMIVKKIDDPELRDILQTEVLDGIIAADPTSNKKYVEWAARRISDIARKEIDDQYLQRYATAQKDPDGFMPSGPARGGPLDPEGRQPLTYDAEKLKRIKGMSRQDRFSAGYLTNAEKLDSDRGAIRSIVFAKLQSLQSRLPIYHKAAQRGLIDKNIDKFKELYDWEHQVYKAEQEMYERDHMKKIEKGAKEQTDYLHDDDDYMIVRPRSADSSCYYGKGTKWCISATRSRNYFDQYTGEGVGFYFVLFKHLAQADPYKKMALVYRPGEDEPGEVFDAEDDDVGIDALRDAVENNVFSAAIRRIFKPKLRQMKKDGLDVQKHLQERIEEISGAYQELDDILGDLDWKKATYASNLLAQAGEKYEYMFAEEGYDVEQLKVAGPKLEILKPVLEELGLDEGSLEVAYAPDIQEHIGELVSEQYYDIISTGAGHFEDNPAGPSEEDFQAELESHKYDYVYVSYDEYEPGRMYWDGGFSLDFTDIHEDLEDANGDEVENVLRKLLDDHHVFPDEFDGWGTDISIRFSPDYDENEGLQGFQNFLNRMDDVDLALHKILEDDLKETIAAFKDAGLLSGDTVKSLKERFDELELENFEVDIEENELSIYARFDITVPIPAHLYKGLTADAPTWTSANRADISKSKALEAFDAMVKQRSSEHADQLIQHIHNTFDKVFEMYANKLQSALPGFEKEVPEREQMGLIIPEYNVGIYQSAQKTQVGPSGLLTPYFFDVRIEADEEESLEESNLKLIELFLKTVDRKEMIDKIRYRFEEIVQNDTIRNVVPQFKQGGEAPEIDPGTGRVVSKAEREEAESQRRSQAVDELSTMFESKKKIKILIKESVPFGGYSPGLAGTFGANRGASLQPHAVSDPGNLGKDLEKVAKAVLHRNNKVLLLRNERGWDLPGGHIKEGEDIISGLKREVFEETGLTISDVTSLGARHSNKEFFCASFARDDMRLSEEHSDFAFVDIEKIEQLEELSPHYKKAIMMCLGGGAKLKENKIPKIKIIIG